MAAPLFKIAYFCDLKVQDESSRPAFKGKFWEKFGAAKISDSAHLQRVPHMNFFHKRKPAEGHPLNLCLYAKEEPDPRRSNSRRDGE